MTPEARMVIAGAAAAALFVGAIGLAAARLRTSSDLRIPAVELGIPAGGGAAPAGRIAPPAGGRPEPTDTPALPVTSIVQYASTHDYPARAADGTRHEDEGPRR